MAFSVDVVWVVEEAGLVTAVGGFGSVLNVPSEPLLVPPALVAEIRKWYVVFGVSPMTDADTATGLVPDPGSDEHAAVDP